MVSNSLRKLLQSLCCDSPWDYAVFWRLQQHQNQMLLTWEDGSFNMSRQREPVEDVMDSFYCNWSNKGLFSRQSDDETGNFSDCPIGVMVAEMSSIYYVIGKGIVGEVFHSESPRWIFADSIMAGGCDFNLTSECPDELLHQFVAGIKTILLVPLVPFGVLQLGSRDKVVEDAGLVTCVKNYFEAHQLTGDFAPFSLDRKLLVLPPEVDYSGVRSFGELSAISINTMDEDVEVLGSIDVHIPNPDQMLSMVQNLYGLYQSDMSGVTDNGIRSKINVHSLGISDAAENFMCPMFESSSEIRKNVLRSSCIDEELGSFISDHEMAHHNMTVHEITESYSNEVTMEWLIEKEESENIIHKSESQVLRFPSDCELHKALGSALWEDHMDLNLLQPASSGENSASGSERRCDTVHCIQPYWNSGGQSTEEKKVEHLLQAMVGNGSSISDDSSSQRSHSTTTSLKASSERLASPQTAQGVLAGDDHVPWSSVTSTYTHDSRMHASSLDCMIDALIGHQLQRDDNKNVRPSKGSKPSSANKRRARPNGNHKPRPRDRQLIQDRIKELRELVPHGSKCSIDGLLVRAIKHMQFLRRVTDQAGKIQQHLLSKGSDQKSLKAHAIKSSSQNGTSWALELGCDQHTFPIIVKDVEYPGLMLIEMACNDHGRFLEIADVIYRLELTILKGVMERRSDDSTWAHFVVEASGNFHRLDIFWPLMQLLQQNRTQISSKI